MAVRIFWAGDSTVQYNDIYTYPQTGIGQVLHLFLKQQIQVKNFALNGRSTKSFIEEKHLDAIDREIAPNDILLIQFGHNDEKLESPERGTQPFGDFQDNLRSFMEVAWAHSAFPVLVTPVYRRHFDENGKVCDNVHLEYPDAMREVGERAGVPVIDLCERSKQFLAKVGDEASKKYYMNFPAGMYDNYPEGSADNTHLRYDGAVLYAGMVAEGLKRLGGRYSAVLLRDISESHTQPLSYTE